MLGMESLQGLSERKVDETIRSLDFACSAAFGSAETLHRLLAER